MHTVTIEHEIAIGKGDQMGARECYFNFLRKAEPRDINLVLLDVEIVDYSKDIPLNKIKTSRLLMPLKKEGLLKRRGYV